MAAGIIIVLTCKACDKRNSYVICQDMKMHDLNLDKDVTAPIICAFCKQFLMHTFVI